MEEELIVEDEENEFFETELNEEVVFEAELRDRKEFELLGEILS